MNDPTPTPPSIWNVPNRLTAARLLLAVAVFFLLPLQYYITAMILFIIAAATDWVDGYWARRYNQVTQLGRVFDPVVDKILICGTFIMLVEEMHDYEVRVWGWLAVLVTCREMLVTVLRSYIEQHGGDFSAKMPGKLKMVFQCVAAGAAMLALAYGTRGSGPEAVPAWLTSVLTISIVLTVVYTVYSGVGYIKSAVSMLRATD